MKRFRVIGAMVPCMALFLAAGCSEKSLETTYSKQEKNIETIISGLQTSGSDVTVTEKDGADRVTLKQGTGEALSKNGKADIYYAAHYITGTTLGTSNLFATNYKHFADSVGWVTSDSLSFVPRTVSPLDKSLVKGLRYGLEGIKAGEECYILFSGRFGFGSRSYGIVPANSALAYHIWVIDVKN